MREYHKIYPPFQRDTETNKLTSEYRNRYIEYLADLQRQFKDKIDGTNVRVIRDGHEVYFKGRKDSSELPIPLIHYLNENFQEEKMEEIFEDKYVELYGEGCGGSIQGMSKNYGIDQHFVLFDAFINNHRLEYGNVKALAGSLGVKCVDLLLEGTIQDGVDYVKSGACVEGLIGIPSCPLIDRNGNRIIVKIKNKDFVINK